VLGALSGLALCAATGFSLAAGAILCAAGERLGHSQDFRHARLWKASGLPDWVIALAEDLVAVGGGLLLVSRIMVS